MSPNFSYPSQIVVRLIQKGDPGEITYSAISGIGPGLGAGMVGYDSSQPYAIGTVGEGLQSCQTTLSNRISAVETGQSSAVIGYDTQANLFADLTPADKSVAYVTNDPTPANNGTYRKSGPTGSGSWVQSSYDRVALVEAKAAGIGITFAAMMGDGVTTSAYLQRNHPDDYLTKSGGWEGTQILYPTPRTNMLPYSDRFDLWLAASGVVITPNATTAPDGTMTADLVDLSAAALSSGISYLNFTATPGVPLNHSVWLKGFSGGEQLYFKDTSTDIAGITCTLTTEWQRFVVSVTPAGTTHFGPWVEKANGGTNKFYIWGADTKVGPLSSLIKTNGSPVTVTDYTLANNLVTLASAPATGEVVQWTPSGVSVVPIDAQTLGSGINDAVVKATPVDADSLGLSDSAAGNIAKKLTWANLKATLDARYFFTDDDGEVVRAPFYITSTQTNAVIGKGALSSNTTGSSLAGLGYGVFVANTTGYTNVAIGSLAARWNTSGSGIVAVGTEALYSNTTAYYNTAVGDGCLWSVTTGRDNVAMGAYAGHNLTGSANLFLGHRAGTYQAAVDNTLILDTLWRANAADELANALVVGNIGQDTSQAQWLRINGDLQVKHRLQILGKALTDNGATTTFTYPANTSYQYITTSSASLAITLPATSAALDGLVITLVAGSSVATATWVAGTGGATIVGAPSSLVANVPVRMIYHDATTQWLPY